MYAREAAPLEAQRVAAAPAPAVLRRRAKLFVGAVDDVAEQEADRIAGEVIARLSRSAAGAAVDSATGGVSLAPTGRIGRNASVGGPGRRSDSAPAGSPTGRIRRAERDGAGLAVAATSDGADGQRVSARLGPAEVGSASIRVRDRTTAELTDLHVAPEHRGSGYGRVVVGEAAARAQRLGASRVALASDDAGSGHLDAWYRDLGFETAGVDDGGHTEFAAAVGGLVGDSTSAGTPPSGESNLVSRRSVDPDATGVIRRMKRGGSGDDDRGRKKRRTNDNRAVTVADSPSPPPRQRSARTRKPAKKYDDEYADEDTDALMAADPDEFGLAEDEVDTFVADNLERENRVDETLAGARGGMSGIARSDKGDEALAAWLANERPAAAQRIMSELICNYAPTRHSLVDLDDRVVSERVPSQQAAMSHLPPDALEELSRIGAMIWGSSFSERKARADELAAEFITNVSANRLMGHDKADDSMDREGFEILHMSGRAVGNPILVLPDEAFEDIIGDEPMETWTGRSNTSKSFTAPQHPGNLAVGTFAANTLMMAIEGKMSKEQKDFVVETRAYAPRGSRHFAAHIIMTVEHKPSDQSRSYYISGLGRYAPEEVYRHIEADIHAFVENAKATAEEKSSRTTYEYPTSDDLLALRALAVQKSQQAGKGATAQGATNTGGSAPVSTAVGAAAAAGSQSTASSKPAALGPAVTPIMTSNGWLNLNQTAGAGNCFFHSIFEAKTGIRSGNADQQRQREAVLEALQNNPALVQSHFNGFGTPQWNAFATTILLEGAWAANQTPAIVADALVMRITIHNPDGSIYFDAVPTAALVGPPQSRIHVYYDGGHYNSYTQIPL